MRILVDQDGTIADWGTAYGALLDTYGDDALNIPRHHQQSTFNLNEGRTALEKKIIAEIMVSPEFYRALAPIEGAKNALRQMIKSGHDVRIVTSPWVSHPTCASDKLNWVVKNYGQEWGKRVIITTDKTLVRGDVLIDDKPEITGAEVPEWEHILFDQPYNRSIDRPRITDWANWSEAVGEALLVKW